MVRLKVAGAFHTHYMAPAAERLRAHAEKIDVGDPTRPLLLHTIPGVGVLLKADAEAPV